MLPAYVVRRDAHGKSILTLSYVIFLVHILSRDVVMPEFYLWR